jgi:hypothetical protein
MADDPKQEEKKSHWWQHDRIQGVGIMLLGIGMLFSPLTNPYAGSVIAAGVGWMTAGAKNAVVRKAKNGVK